MRERTFEAPRRERPRVSRVAPPKPRDAAANRPGGAADSSRVAAAVRGAIAGDFSDCLPPRRADRAISARVSESTEPKAETERDAAPTPTPTRTKEDAPEEEDPADEKSAAAANAQRERERERERKQTPPPGAAARETPAEMNVSETNAERSSRSSASVRAFGVREVACAAGWVAPPAGTRWRARSAARRRRTRRAVSRGALGESLRVASRRVRPFRARNRETKASEDRCGRVLAVERDAPETGGGGGRRRRGGKKKTSSSREKASPPPGWTLVLDGGGEKGSGGATTRSPVSCVSNVACDEGEVRGSLARVADGDADAALATLGRADDDGGDEARAGERRDPRGNAAWCSAGRGDPRRPRRG